jgi:hypothetical protein
MEQESSGRPWRGREPACPGQGGPEDRTPSRLHMHGLYPASALRQPLAEHSPIDRQSTPTSPDPDPERHLIGTPLARHPHLAVSSAHRHFHPHQSLALSGLDIFTRTVTKPYRQIFLLHFLVDSG